MSNHVPARRVKQISSHSLQYIHATKTCRPCVVGVAVDGVATLALPVSANKQWHGTCCCTHLSTRLLLVPTHGNIAHGTFDVCSGSADLSLLKACHSPDVSLGFMPVAIYGCFQPRHLLCLCFSPLQQAPCTSLTSSCQEDAAPQPQDHINQPSIFAFTTSCSALSSPRTPLPLTQRSSSLTAQGSVQAGSSSNVAGAVAEGSTPPTAQELQPAMPGLVT